MSTLDGSHGEPSHRRRGARSVLTVVVLLALAGAACGSAQAAPVRAAAPAAAPSLATSIDTSAGSFAVLPMGDLSQPLNTFWQLFFRPRGASGWSDISSVLAVATNGGLVMAAAEGQPLAVGVRPANLLQYSPLLLTSDGGRSWSPASPTAALAGGADALAVGSTGTALALTATPGGEEVLESSGQLARWRELTTSGTLGSARGVGACGLVSVTAVALQAATPVLGVQCRRAGTVGLLSATAAGWALTGPRLPSPLAAARVEVLGLLPTASGLCALLAASGRQGTALVAAWRRVGGTSWRTAPVLTLGAGRVRSFGPEGRSGLFVLTSSSGGHESAEVLGGPGRSWSRLPAPPAGTETLVFGPAGTVDALAAHDIVFSDWELDARSGSWRRAQVVDVPIEFGSSS